MYSTRKKRSQSTSMQDIPGPQNITKMEQSRAVIPRNLDILCGSGKAASRHPGNVRFRAIVVMHFPEYERATNRRRKAQVVQKVLNDVLSSNVTNFLKKDPIFDRFYIASERVGRDKVSHSLREMQAAKSRCTYTNSKHNHHHSAANSDHSQQLSCLGLSTSAIESFNFDAASTLSCKFVPMRPILTQDKRLSRISRLISSNDLSPLETIRLRPQLLSNRHIAPHPGSALLESLTPTTLAESNSQEVSTIDTDTLSRKKILNNKSSSVVYQHASQCLSRKILASFKSSPEVKVPLQTKSPVLENNTAYTPRVSKRPSKILLRDHESLTRTMPDESLEPLPFPVLMQYSKILKLNPRSLVC